MPAINFIDLTNRKFGRLRVLERASNMRRKARWICQCDCGNMRTVTGVDLRIGNTKSCGCHKRDMASARMSRHRMTGTPEYKAWSHLKARCLNPNDKRYPDYGGRGIKVCARWLDSFENFYADMGIRPVGATSIGRKNNNGDYTPDNCGWENRIQQARNTRHNRYLTAFGRTQLMVDWARELHIDQSNLHLFLRSKSMEEIVRKYAA